MKNLDIRQKATEANIRFWQIAEKLGISDGNFSRKLRKELPDTTKKKIFSIIEILKTEMAG